MVKKILDDCIVVIRSVGERTEELCKYAIQQNGINPEHIFMIKNKAPFSKALKEGHKLAIKQNKTFTFFIDADQIILPNSLEFMLNVAINLPKKTLFINPLCYDYITRKIISNGPHLYRTKYLKYVLKNIPEEKDSLRPETFSVKKTAKEHGLEIVYLDFISSFHEFEQYNRDIFKRVFNKIKKMGDRNFIFEKKINFLKSKNKDFEIAAQAYKFAKDNKIKLELNHKQFDSEFNKLNLKEKNKILNLKATYLKLLKKRDSLNNEFEFLSYSKRLILLENKTFLQKYFSSFLNLIKR